MTTSLATVLGWLWLSLAAPQGGLLSDPDAERLFEEAQAAFETGDFETASDKLERAYLIEPKAALLYPWAQAERNRGRCSVALDLYRRFLATEPPEKFVVATQENIERCEAELAEAEASTESSEDEDESDGEDAVPVEEEPAETPATPAEPTRKDRSNRRWYVDPTGDVLASIGIAGVAIGGGLVGAAMADAKSAPSQSTNDAYVARRERAIHRRDGGLAALSVGSALLLGGVIRWIVVAKRDKSDRSAALFFPRGGVGLVVSGRF